MNESITKLRVFRILRTILNFGFWLTIAASAVFLVLLITNPGSVSFSLTFDGFRISSEALFIIENSSLYKVVAAMLLLIGVLCIWMLKNIVNSLSDGSPFIKENVKRIRIIGFAILVQAYAKQFLFYTFAKGLMDGSAKTGVSSVLQPRMNLIPESALLAFCILVLAEIFNFGCTLQNEHDTTV